MKYPFFGYRRMTRALKNRGHEVNRKQIRRLMHGAGSGVSEAEPQQAPACQVPPFLYLFNIIDWYSRKVIDYELSSTLEKGFVLTCLKRAFRRCKPEIMNSDQGSHFTNASYLALLEQEGIQISMDGKGRATDNNRTERYFMSLKYECIFLNEFENPRELRKGIAAYVQFYNTERPHQSLDEITPDHFYAQSLKTKAS